MNTFKKIALTAFASLALFAVTDRAEAGVSGLYYDHTGRSAIQVSRCGGGLCGRIVWLKNKAHNKVCGTAIIGGGHKVGNAYDAGWIYNPETGKRYNVEVTPMGNSLKVMGYAGSKFLSKTMMWRRAPSNLERCA
jgi:uncharacterized protein (DUF2147 family)